VKPTGQWSNKCVSSISIKLCITLVTFSTATYKTWHRISRPNPRPWHWVSQDQDTLSRTLETGIKCSQDTDLREFGRKRHLAFLASSGAGVGRDPVTCDWLSIVQLDWDDVTLATLHQAKVDVAGRQLNCRHCDVGRKMHTQLWSITNLNRTVATSHRSLYTHDTLTAISWLLGHSGSIICHINKVTLHWARLVLGWMTIFEQVYHLGM